MAKNGVPPHKNESHLRSHHKAEGGTLAGRLLLARKAVGLKQSSIAKKYGVALKTWANYESGRSFPDANLLMRMTEEGYNADWLLTGDGEMYGSGSVVEGGDTILLPHLDVRVSAGDGELVQTEEEKGKFPFDRAYFRRALNIDPRFAVMVEVQGDSMYPTLAPNDPVMVNIAQPQSIVDGVWVVRINETTLVKRIQQLPDGLLRVISDNPAYEAFTFDMKEEQPDFALIGRVVWAPRRY